MEHRVHHEGCEEEGQEVQELHKKRRKQFWTVVLGLAFLFFGLEGFMKMIMDIVGAF